MLDIKKLKYLPKTSQQVFSLFLCFVIWLVLSSSAYALTINAGVNDNFFDDGLEAANPSAALVGSITNFGATSLSDFDTGSQDSNIAHTFDMLPDNILSASLTFRVRRSSGGGEGDGLVLAFVDDAIDVFSEQIAYRRTFGIVGDSNASIFSEADQGLLTPGIPWGPGAVSLFTIDLANLQLNGGGTLDLISDIETNGYLDVILGDDSEVDFIQLNVQAVPVPPSIILFLSSLIFLLFGFRKSQANDKALVTK